MPEINRRDRYDINDLINMWKCGWGRLAELGKILSPLSTFGFENACLPKDPSYRICHGFCQAFCDMIHRPGGEWFASMFLALAATPKNQSFAKVGDKPDEIKFMPHNWRKTRSGKNEVARQRFVGKVTNAFANSTTVEEAFSKIGTVRQRNEFIEFCSGLRVQKHMAVTIGGCWTKAMEWLNYGLKSEAACEEAFWSCVWCYLEPDVEVMLEIKNRIDTDVPLADDQYNLLNHHMSAGRAKGYVFHMSGKGQTYGLVLEPDFLRVNPHVTDLKATATGFLAQPAFHLANDLQSSCPKPRFVRQCRAPSCGEHFYTNRKSQVVCGGSRGHRKTRCALEWKHYRYWLTALGKDPNDDWNNPRQKEAFQRRNR